MRDACARLPEGLGTRADVLELLKHSQWVNLEDTPLEAQYNTMSGALERLHQMDQCVRYDNDKKLWLNLHRWHKIDSPLWQPKEPDRRRNDFANNSFMPLGLDGGPHPLTETWLRSYHRMGTYQ